jgi:iron complex outermembrane recepter protein
MQSLSPITFLKRQLVVLAYIIVIISNSSAAIEHGMVLKGRVVDSAGAALSGATVEIRFGSKTLVVRSHSDGSYMLEGLAAGKYDINVRAEGFSSEKKSISLSSDSGATFDFTLRPGSITESITVLNEESGKIGSEQVTRLSVPIMDLPQSVQVIGQKTIEDQFVLRPAEAVRNVSGTVRKPAYLGLTDSYGIRGFTAPIGLMNGFRRDHYYSYSDISTIERIEVLKGPASVTHGFLEPGGVVNYVTKEPTVDHLYSFDFKTGSYGYVRPAIDFSGPLNRSKTIRYRLNSAYEQSDSFRDYVDSKLFSIAPVLDWDLSERTLLRFQFGYVRSDSVPDRGLYNSMGPIILDLPRERFLGEPEDIYKVNQYDFQINLDHQFNEMVRLRSGFSVNSYGDYRDNFQIGRLLADQRTATRTYSVVESNNRYFNLFNDLSGSFNTGALRHNFVAGFDLIRSNAPYSFRRSNATSLDIYNPVYGAARVHPPLLFNVDADTESAGIYLQDHIQLTKKLKFLAAGRFDFFRHKQHDFMVAEDSRIIKRAFSPKVGLVYQPIDSVSLYTSYSQGFNPNTWARTADNLPVDPETGQQIEGGVKLNLFEGRLQPTLSVYQIRKRNVAVSDPNDPTGSFYIQSGEQKSKGVEFDATLLPARGIILLASYGYTEAYVSADSTIPVGDRLVNVPKHGASLWGTYEFQSGMLRNFGVGSGFFYVDKREATLPNRFTIPSYTRVDASVFYRGENWRAGLNFKNLTDTIYYDSQDNLLYPGAPRSVFAVISYRF